MKTIQTLLFVASLALSLFQFCGSDSYNCHNFAWETERRWLEDPTPYIEQAREVEPEYATHVVYYQDGKPIHSAYYLGHGVAYGKWGKNSLMVHPVHLSAYGHDVRYFAR